MGNEHHLKTWPKPFDDMKRRLKNFEYRKDDREPKFEVGDILILEEYLPPMGTKTNGSTTATDIGEYTGEILKRRVTLVYRGGQFGIPNGYCIMSVVPLKEGDLGFA